MGHKNCQAGVQEQRRISPQGALHSAWQGLKTMASVNTAVTTTSTIQVEGSCPSTLPGDLNARFDLRQHHPTCGDQILTQIWQHYTHLQHSRCDQSPQEDQREQLIRLRQHQQPSLEALRTATRRHVPDPLPEFLGQLILWILDFLTDRMLEKYI